MRAVVVQECRVCFARCTSKEEMDDHRRERHGVNWQPNELRPVEQQADTGPLALTHEMFSAGSTPVHARQRLVSEFEPHLMQTPWGKELR
jgi:hypothetical protein